MTTAAGQSSIHDALEVLHQSGVKTRYDNYIGGNFVPPTTGRYFVSTSPINQEPICEFARSGAADVELALDAAHAIKDQWAHTSQAERSTALLKIASVLEENLETLALAETLDNGKPIRETRNADIPLVIDHFRYFAACIRAEEGRLTDIDNDTVAFHYKEPLGVVGQIIPWNFPLLMAAWKLAPAIGAGNCVVIKPASNTPLSIMYFAQLVGPLLPLMEAGG